MTIKRTKSQLGASMVELALLISLIAVVAFPSVKSLGRQVKCQNYRYIFTLKVAQCSGCNVIANGVMYIRTQDDYMQEITDDFNSICNGPGGWLLDVLW